MKVLGILAMIDEGEMDWKVIAINTKDPDAKNLNSGCDHINNHPLETTLHSSIFCPEEILSSRLDHSSRKTKLYVQFANQDNEVKK